MRECFELVPHDILVEEARAVGYPLPLLRLALAAYRLPRSLSVGGVCSALVNAERGIAAGSGPATTELRVLIIRLLDRVARAHPAVKLTAYVDDLSLEAAGTRSSAADSVIQAGKTLCSGLVELGLKLSTSGKCVVTASTDGVGTDIAEGLREFGIVYQRRAKSLGVGVAGGRRRNTAVQKSRLRSLLGRLARMAAVAFAGLSPARLVEAGALPAMVYGDDCYGVSDATLMQRRRKIASVVATGTKGTNIDLALALAETHGASHVDPAYLAHVLPITRWAEARWSNWVPGEVLTKSLEAARLELAKAKSPWMRVAGPSAAMLATTARLGWSVKDVDTIITDDGRILDLKIDPPIVIKDEVIRAVRRWRWKRIVQYAPQLGCGGDPDADGELVLAPVRKVLQTSARSSSWTSAQQAALRSVAVGAQWTQSRLCRAGMVDSDACQFCAAFGCHPGVLPPAGTLRHRSVECPIVAATARGALSSSWVAFRAIRRRIRMIIGLGSEDDYGDDPMAMTRGARRGRNGAAAAPDGRHDDSCMGDGADDMEQEQRYFALGDDFTGPPPPHW